MALRRDRFMISALDDERLTDPRRDRGDRSPFLLRHPVDFRPGDRWSVLFLPQRLRELEHRFAHRIQAAA